MWTLIRVHTVCKNDFYNHKQMTKQMTIVVIGSLRVNAIEKHCSSSNGVDASINL